MNLEIIRAVQRFSNPFLDTFFTLMTMFGEKVLLAGVFCLVYWCVDRRLGRYLIFCLSCTVALNGLLKDFFQITRPVGAPGIISKRLQTATGYSFPSGHTQSAATFWWALAVWKRRPVAYALCGSIVLCVGLSRIYLGVHYPTDVLGGLVVGIFVPYFLHYLLVVKKWVGLCLLGITALGVGAVWRGVSDDTLYAGAMALALLPGYWTAGRADVSTKGTLIRKLLRYCLGMSIIGAIYLLPPLFMEKTALLKAVQTGLIVYFAVGAYPRIFAKLRL